MDLKRILGLSPWKPEWQEGLSKKLQDTQRGLNTSLVVIVARESDLYTEILFLFSALGFGLGMLVSIFLEGFVEQPTDILLPPIAGFTLGATLYAARHWYIHWLAPRAVRQRVLQKAKSQFFDHSQNLKSKIFLLYLSEMEREALVLTSPEIQDAIPQESLQRVLGRLLTAYSEQDPLVALNPCLNQVGELLRQSSLYEINQKEVPASRAFFVVAGDKKPQLTVPVLKANKDIN